MLKITCYGGVGEIGGNKVMLEDSGSAIMLDFGKSFSKEAAYFDEFLKPRTNSALRDLLTLGLLPAIEGIYRHDLLRHAGVWAELADELPESARRLFECDLPSYREYAKKDGPRVHGVLVSHAHGDHAQHISFLDPSIPVYCTEVTRAILRAVQDVGRGGYESDIVYCFERKVRKCGDTSTFPGELTIDPDKTATEREIRAVGPCERMEVGGFEVEAIPVDHSVPGACSYLIQTPSGKRVFYTGDVRFRGRYSVPPTDLTSKLRARTRRLAPDALIIEGTRIDSQSADTEAGVEKAITEDIRACKGLAIVDFGWKDTTRFVTVLNAAKSAGRVLAVNPKLAYLWSLLRKIEPENYPDLAEFGCAEVYLKRTDSQTYSRSDYANGKYIAGINLDWGTRGANLKDQPESRENPYLCHYYGGVRAYEIAAEPAKYVLHAGFFDMNELVDVNPPQGSIFIKAATEPFSDEMELDDTKLKNWLRHYRVSFKEDKQGHIASNHISGHASGPDLLEFMTDMRPARVIPIHTEKPELFRTALSGSCEVILPSAGEPITL